MLIMSYEALTVNDPNPIKRWLHSRRYATAVKKMGKIEQDATVLDFGAGSGELAHTLLGKRPDLRMTLFEPSPSLVEEITEGVAPLGDHVEVATNFDDIRNRSFSAIFCLSVFEHLPQEDIEVALQNLYDVSSDETETLVEVPNELYIAALIKGAFRHVRRPEAYDGKISNVAKASIGKSPEDRPLIDPTGIVELPWYGYHTGFDHRDLEQQLRSSELFQISGPDFSPLHALGSIASLDVYYSLSREDQE